MIDWWCTYVCEQEILDERDSNPPGIGTGGAEFERMMWEDVPWVACAKGNCSKTISKEAWMQDRGGQCTAKIVEYLDENPGALAVELDLCNLNSQMDSLCKSIIDSVLKVGGINCMAAGVDTCLPKSYFYTPSTYSSSNQQVNRFYSLPLYSVQFKFKCSAACPAPHPAAPSVPGACWRPLPRRTIPAPPHTPSLPRTRCKSTCTSVRTCAPPP